MDVLHTILSRKSVRSYTGGMPSEDELNILLSCAYAAPVGMAKYDCYHLTVITNPELLKRLDENAAVFFGNPSMHPLYNAPVLILVSSCEEGNVASANVGMIIHNMALEAVNLGLGHVDIYGAIRALEGKDELLAALKLPEGYHPMGALAVGKTTETYGLREVKKDRITTSYLR